MGDYFVPDKRSSDVLIVLRNLKSYGESSTRFFIVTFRCVHLEEEYIDLTYPSVLSLFGGSFVRLLVCLFVC